MVHSGVVVIKEAAKGSTDTSSNPSCLENLSGHGNVHFVH